MHIYEMKCICECSRSIKFVIYDYMSKKIVIYHFMIICYYVCM